MLIANVAYSRLTKVTAGLGRAPNTLIRTNVAIKATPSTARAPMKVRCNRSKLLSR